MCFIFSILAELFPKKHNKSLHFTYRKYLKYLSYDFLTFPVQINAIAKFEQRNILSINVYGYKNEIYPIYKNKHNVYKEVNLLLYKKHYFFITKFEKSGIHKYCKICLTGFARQSTLDAHVKRCLHNEPRSFRLPTNDNKYLKFNSFHKMSFSTILCLCRF